MRDPIEQLDITALSDYRRRLGRGSVAGIVTGVLVAGGAMTQAAPAGNATRAGLLLAGGVGIVLLSLWLRRGNVVAARLLSPVVALGIIVVLKLLVVRWRGASLGGRLVVVAFTGIVALPLFVSWIGGIEAVLEFREGQIGAMFPALDFHSLSHPLIVVETELRRLEQQVAHAKTFLAISETMVLLGAGALLVGAVWRLAATPRPQWLALVGFLLLLLGLEGNLRTVGFLTRKMRDRLANDPRPPVLLVRSDAETLVKVRARFTLPRALSSGYPRISLEQIIREQMLACGPVVTLNLAAAASNSMMQHEAEQAEKMVPLRRRNGWQREPIRWPSGVTHWLKRAGCIVTIPAGTTASERHLPTMTSALMQQKGMWVFPPDARCGRPDWCESIRPLPAPLVSSDVRQALLLVFRGEQTPLLLTAQTPDEWAYEVALRIAAEMLRPQARHAAPQIKQADSTLWLAEPSEMASV